MSGRLLSSVRRRGALETGKRFATAALSPVALRESQTVGTYQGSKKLRWWIEEGQCEEKKKQGRGGLWETLEELETFKSRYNGGNGKGSGNGNRDKSSATATHQQTEKLSRVVVGFSRKSTLGRLAGTPDATTGSVAASVAAAVAAYEHGAAILRVHDVQETVEALAVVRALA